MTGYAVEFHIPTDKFMSSFTELSTSARASRRAWIRRYANGVWATAKAAGAPRLSRFLLLVGVQWPQDTIYPAVACDEAAKPVIDAMTDQGLIPDDSPEYRVFTGYFEVPGTSPYGVSLTVFIVPLASGEAIPSAIVSRAPGAVGVVRKLTIRDADWLTSNMRLDPSERKARQERVMAASADLWKGVRLTGNVALLCGVRYPNGRWIGDPDNVASTACGITECGAVLGALPRKPAMTGFFLLNGESRSGTHDIEVLALQAPDDAYWPTLLTA